MTDPGRRALIVGIDRYETLPFPLAGCVNDAGVIRSLLVDRFGFPAERVTTLLDEEATRDRILGALDEFVQQVGDDEIVVISYSGHGSQMTDREGDEPDGLDETIVPHDSGRTPHPNRDISDDELYIRLLALTGRTPHVTLLFDCCHSGSVSRDAFGGRSRWVPPDLRPVEALPASSVPRDVLGQRPRDIGPSGWLPLADRYVLIAGCRDDESSYEHTVVEGDERVTHGALTYFLSQAIASAGPGTTYRDVFERASAEVTGVEPRQHPQLEGAADRALFGIGEIGSAPFVVVTGRSDRRATIGAGLAHGVTLGSRWGAYPPGTKEPVVTERLGTLEVTAARATSSDARVVEESARGAIQASCRAVEEVHAYGDRALRVQVVAPADEDTDRMVSAVQTSDLLRQVAEDEPADVRVYLLGPRAEAGPNGPVPQLPRVDRATWAVVGADGLLMMPTHAVGGPASETVVVDNLERAARYRRVLALRNADGALRGKLEMRLLRIDADGRWTMAGPEPGGRVVFAEGDRIGLEIENRHTAPLYVSVLDLGVAGAIGLLFPAAAASQQLVAGGSVRVGVREGDELVLAFPEGVLPPDPADDRPVEGTETFKLIATTAPARFDALLQGGFRAIDETRSVAEDLMAVALRGGRRDVARPVAAAPADSWTTVERTFSLRRRTA